MRTAPLSKSDSIFCIVARCFFAVKCPSSKGKNLYTVPGFRRNVPCETVTFSGTRKYFENLCQNYRFFYPLVIYCNKSGGRMVLNLKACTASPKRDIVILLTGPVALTGELIPPKVSAGCRRQIEGLPAQTLPRNTPTLLPRNVSYVTKTPCRFDTSHKTYTPAHFTLEIVMMLDYNRYKIVSSTPIIEIGLYVSLHQKECDSHVQALYSAPA